MIRYKCIFHNEIMTINHINSFFKWWLLYIKNDLWTGLRLLLIEELDYRILKPSWKQIFLRIEIFLIILLFCENIWRFCNLKWQLLYFLLRVRSLLHPLSLLVVDRTIALLLFHLVDEVGHIVIKRRQLIKSSIAPDLLLLTFNLELVAVGAQMVL